LKKEVGRPIGGSQFLPKRRGGDRIRRRILVFEGGRGHIFVDELQLVGWLVGRGWPMWDEESDEDQ
jgi:hypothetical protein